MNDMSSVIVAKSDQINADDLVGTTRTITITGVKIAPGEEQPVSISIAGDRKVFRPCKTVSRILVGLWGPDASKYVGKSLTLYRDPDVTWGGVKVGGIRVSHASDINGTQKLSVKESQKKFKTFEIRPLSVGQQQAPAEDERTTRARTFAEKHITKIEAAMSDADLHQLRADAETGLASLATSYPELRQKVSAAYDRRFSELADGPSDAQRGEKHNDDGFGGDASSAAPEQF